MSVRAPRTAKQASDREIEEGGGDSMLARYFREMATHPVMGQAEELHTAVDVENAEIEHWTAILSFTAAADDALEGGAGKWNREGHSEGRATVDSAREG